MTATVTAFCARDVKIWRSYRIAVLGQVVSSVLAVASFALLAPSVRADVAGLDGVSYLGFAAIGIAVVGLLLAAAQSMSGSVRDAQLEGTLESILSTPVDQRHAVVCLGVWPFLTSVAFSSIVLVTAAAMGDTGFHVSPIPFATVALVSLALFAALGLASAAFVLVARRGDPVALALGLAGGIAAGAYAPVETFPSWLQALAELNPLTHALDAWRSTLLEAGGFADVAGSLAVLSVSALLTIPLAWWLLGRALTAARRDGLLSGY